MKSPGEPSPTSVRIVLAARPAPTRTVGFIAIEQVPALGGSEVEYEWQRSTEAKERYVARIDGYEEALYIPQEFFGTRKRPEQIRIQVV